MKKLRLYQSAAIEAISTYFEEHNGNCLVVVPTGGGKSLILCSFIKDAIEQWSDTRIVVVTHSKELIAQSYKELIGYWPDAPAGIYSAGLGKRDLRSQIVFAGIQSIHRKAYNLQRVDLVIIDEAQMLPRSSNTTYRRFLDDLKVINPYVKIIGLTATPFRLDSGRLHIGEGAIFDGIAYDANIRDLMDDGYLTRLISVSGTSQIDTTGVAISKGEFVAGQLEAAADDPETVRAVVEETCRYGETRKGWLVFGCGVKHCTDMRDEIRKRGYTAECVFGDTPNGERDRLIAAFKRQEIRCLVSVAVLTTGFDAKHIDMIAIARPTKSTGLFIQICGRGTRLIDPAGSNLPTPEERLAAIARSGKPDCLVLDFGGNVQRHGPIDAPIVKDKKGSAEQQSMPEKVCPECETANHISARQCIGCGYEFPPVVSQISTQASQLEILSGVVRTEWVDVTDVFYNRHQKESKPPTVCVTYACGLNSHREWVCPEHVGFARSKFVQWWNKRVPEFTPPATVDEFLDAKAYIPKPEKIAVRPSGKYSEIVSAQF